MGLIATLSPHGMNLGWTTLILWLWAAALGWNGVYADFDDDISCDVSVTSCQRIPDYISTARLSQRDMAYNASVVEASVLGLNLRTSVFEVEGYTTQALSTIHAALEIGYNQLIIDAYYSVANAQWQLCPVAFPSQATSDNGLYYTMENPWQPEFGGPANVTCQSNVTFDSIYSVLANYIHRSDTNLAVNVLSIKFLLNLLNETVPGTNHSSPAFRNDVKGDLVLGHALLAALPQRVFTRSLLTADQNAGFATSAGQENGSAIYPSMETFLLTNKRRVIASSANVSLGSSHDYSPVIDPEVIFEDNNAYPGTLTWSGPDPDVANQNQTRGSLLYSQCLELNRSRETFEAVVRYQQSYSGLFPSLQDSEQYPFDNNSIRVLTQCGIAPVLNRPLHNINELVVPIENAFWTWAPGQPLAQGNQKSSAKQAVAQQCALLTHEGLKVGNCYAEYPVLCRTPKNSSFNWSLSQSPSNYFVAPASCTGDSEFAVPQTALEVASANLYIASLNRSSFDSGSSLNEFQVWVDLNSIAVEGCWVSGGPFSQCPYYTVASNRNGVALLSVAAAVSFLLLVLMFLLSFRRVSMRHFLLRKKYISDYEGVPA